MDEFDGAAARNTVRSLIDQAVFIPVEGLCQFELEVQGDLARLLRVFLASASLEPRQHKAPRPMATGL